MRRDDLILQKLEKFEEKFNNIDKKFDNIDKKFENLDKRLDGFEKSQEVIIDTLGEMKEQITVLDGRVDKLENTVDKLQNEVFDIKEMIPALATKEELHASESRIMDVLESHTGMLEKQEIERVAMNARIDRVERNQKAGTH